MQIWVLVVTAVLAAAVVGVAVRDSNRSAGSGTSRVSPVFVVLLIGLTVFCLVVPNDRTSLAAGMIAIVVVVPAVVVMRIKAMNAHAAAQPQPDWGRPDNPPSGS